MSQLCVKCHFTDYELTSDFKFTGRWVASGSDNSYHTGFEVEVLITKKIFGFIPWRKTVWLRSDDFIDVEVCNE